VWTVNDEAGMRELVRLGVHGVMTDRADLLKDVLISEGRWT
jgi:glycerophosphoryl diester phosphodiesterase